MFEEISMRKSLTALILGLSLSSASIPLVNGVELDPGVTTEVQIKEILSEAVNEYRTGRYNQAAARWQMPLL